jgi:hypothetical protein
VQAEPIVPDSPYVPSVFGVGILYTQQMLRPRNEIEGRKRARIEMMTKMIERSGRFRFEQLPFDYVHLSNCIRIGAASDPTAEMTAQRAKNAPLALLRQMAHEALNSPDLLKLAVR